VCDEKVGNATLGLKNRGADTMVVADMDLPFGASSCVSCGSCLQVCPTGALMDRASAFMGATAEVKHIKSRCTACSVGCGVELVVRGNRVIRVEGDWDAAPNKGLLCEIGRFHLINDHRKPVREPMVKGAAGWQTASWEDALAQAGAKLKAAGADACTVVSGFATNEAAQAATKLPGAKVQLGEAVGGKSEALSVMDEGDLYIVVDTDLTKDYQVAGFAVKRSVRHRGARAIILDEAENGLRPWAYAQWAPAESAKAVEIAKGAEMPVIVYGPRGAALAAELAKSLPKAKLVGFGSAGNAAGIAAAGIKGLFNGQKAKAYYVIANELAQVDAALLDALKQADFVVVQASFVEPWADVADVILPAPTMFETEGTITNAEGLGLALAAGRVSKLPSVAETATRLGALIS
jgi:formate dehydrogenase major subunit